MIYRYTLSTPHTSTKTVALRPTGNLDLKTIRQVHQHVATCQDRVEVLSCLRHTRNMEAKKANAQLELEKALLRASEEPLLVDNAVFAVNKQIFQEVTKYIREQVPFLIQVGHRVGTQSRVKKWSKQEERLLVEAQYITVSYYLLHRHNESPVLPFTTRGLDSLARRNDIKTFHFQGTGHPLLADSHYEQRGTQWVRVDPRFGPFGYTCDTDLFQQLLEVLANVPKIKTRRGFTVTWRGEEKIPQDIEDEEVQKYKDAVKRLVG